MLIKEEFLKKLRSSFDLNQYEVKIWTALLSKGVASAGTIAEISDVPRSRAYDVLETLEKKGFVIVKLGKPIRYIAVEPSEIIKRVKKRINEHAEANIKMIEGVKENVLFKDLQLLYNQGIKHINMDDLSGSLKGRTNLYDHIETLLKNAKKSVIINTTPEGIVRKASELSHVLSKLSRNGVKIRIATKINDVSKKAVEELSKFAEIKHNERIDARFVIVDGINLVFMLSNDKEVHENYDSGIWVNTPFFAKALEQMFDESWRNLK